MRKADKRKLGVIKFEKDLAEVRARGLKMQNADRKQRNKALKDAEEGRKQKSSKAEPGRSKTAQEKRERVAERLAEQQDREIVETSILAATGVSLKQVGQNLTEFAGAIDLTRRPEWEEMNSYAEADVEVAWTHANPHMGKPMISRSPSKEFIADLNASYGKARTE